MARRYYSSTARRTTLAADINSSVTSLTVAAVSGWPSSFPYTLVLDEGTLSEELVEVSARSGTTVTVTRGVDGTSAVAHTAGATVNHGVSARDFNEPNQFLNEGGTVTGATAVEANSSSAALRITQTGAGNALLVEDSANPDATPFVVDASGNVGIGTTAPEAALHVERDVDNRLRIAQNTSNATSPALILVKRRGTAASPAIVVDGDALGDVNFFGYDGVTLRSGALIRAAVDGTPGSSDMPGRLVFSTTADGASTPTERMRITSAGNVGIGTSSPVTRFHSIGTASGATVATSGTTDSTMVARHQGGSVGIDAGVLSSGTSYLQVRNVNDLSVGYPLLLNPVAGNVGIGTSSPVSLLHVDGGIVTGQRYATSGALILRRANGSAATPTAVSAADSVSVIVGRAYDGVSTYRDVASIGFSASQNTTATQSGGYISLATTADGATSTTERMRIDNAGLITGSGTSLGAWTAYTPTLGGTGWAIGNGTADGLYCQIGKIVHFRVRIIFGTTSTFGTGNVTVSLPVTARTSDYNVTGRLQDSSAGVTYATIPQQSSTTVVQMWTLGTNGLIVTTDATSPFTWASTDQILLSGTYEAA